MKQEDYVTLEVAKLLKSKCFVKNTKAYYKSGKFEWCVFRDGVAYNCLGYNNYYSAPSLAQAAKWLREEHNIAVIPIPYRFVWNYNIYDLKEINEYDWTHKILGSRVNWESYEQALNEGILEALKKIRKEN